MKNTINLETIDKDIHDILIPFLKVNSETATLGEKKSEAFLLDFLSHIPYFKENADHFGSFPIADDPLNRAVSWAMVKGADSNAVILLHHNDIVGVEDFKTLHHFAFQPQLLEKELLKMAGELQSEAREDLLSGEYLFGRGAADMKGGGAIQLALLKRYSEVKNLKGNIILLSLPDEENLSAGMRAAVNLLIELKEKYHLQYQYAFNSEPHQRKNKNNGLISEGSVGKMLAFVYVRGFLSHVGKVFEGLNPLSVLSEIAIETELSPLLSDHVDGESAPPPTWLYLRDRKENYDVSMPLGAGGCLSILTLDSDPTEILRILKKLARHSFNKVIKRMNDRYHIFCSNTGLQHGDLPWKPSVITYSELLKEAQEAHGKEFVSKYEEKLQEVNQKILKKEIDYMESSFLLTEFVYNFISDLSPRIILGLVPPYYPNVSNLILGEIPGSKQNLYEFLSNYSFKQFGQKYDREFYYTGISDLSYFALKNSIRIKEELQSNMPLYGASYRIPLENIEELSLPCMNIGPWGKDFHKLTERVYKKDLYEKTPALLNQAIQYVLQEDLITDCP